MRNEILRDVLAGCAGVLAIAAAIGLPRASAPIARHAAPSGQHYVLLPYYPARPKPPAPPSAHPKIVTGP